MSLSDYLAAIYNVYALVGSGRVVCDAAAHHVVDSCGIRVVGDCILVVVINARIHKVVDAEGGTDYLLLPVASLVLQTYLQYGYQEIIF